jgi:membrane-associated phospholipid phosphatase
MFTGEVRWGIIMTEILYGQESLNLWLFYLINHFQEPAAQLIFKLGLIGDYKMFPVYLGIFLLASWKHGVNMMIAQVPVPVFKQYRTKIIETLILLVVCYAVYIIWVTGLKHLLQMPRPFVRLPEGMVMISDAIKADENPYASFPSGHSSFAMLMLVALWSILNGFGKFIGISLVIFIGISRVNLGVHFPSDVIGSWILSFMITYITLLAGRFVIDKIKSLKFLQ